MEEYANNHFHCSDIKFYDLQLNGILMDKYVKCAQEWTGNEAEPGLYNNKYYNYVAIFQKKN